MYHEKRKESKRFSVQITSYGQTRELVRFEIKIQVRVLFLLYDFPSMYRDLTVLPAFDERMRGFLLPTYRRSLLDYFAIPLLLCGTLQYLEKSKENFCQLYNPNRPFLSFSSIVNNHIILQLQLGIEEIELVMLIHISLIIFNV